MALGLFLQDRNELISQNWRVEAYKVGISQQYKKPKKQGVCNTSGIQAG